MSSGSGSGTGVYSPLALNGIAVSEPLTASKIFEMRSERSRKWIILQIRFAAKIKIDRWSWLALHAASGIGKQCRSRFATLLRPFRGDFHNHSLRLLRITSGSYLNIGRLSLFERSTTATETIYYPTRLGVDTSPAEIRRCLVPTQKAIQGFELGDVENPRKSLLPRRLHEPNCRSRCAFAEDPCHRRV